MKYYVNYVKIEQIRFGGSKMNKILRTLEKIKKIAKDSGWDPESAFSYGECGSLALMLKEIYEEVKIYGLYRDGYYLVHVLISYKGDYYDINGKFTIKDFVRRFNEKEGCNVLREKEYNIGEGELDLDEIHLCCGNYYKNAFEQFDAEEELSNLYNRLITEIDT